jgi:hypothetical protein
VRAAQHWSGCRSGRIQQLPNADVAALAAPILSLVGEMQFYAVMGASTQVIVADMDSHCLSRSSRRLRAA